LTNRGQADAVALEVSGFRHGWHGTPTGSQVVISGHPVVGVLRA
jgi:hypothetical protein